MFETFWGFKSNSNNSDKCSDKADNKSFEIAWFKFFWICWDSFFISSLSAFIIEIFSKIKAEFFVSIIFISLIFCLKIEFAINIEFSLSKPDPLRLNFSEVIALIFDLKLLFSKIFFAFNLASSIPFSIFHFSIILFLWSINFGNFDAVSDLSSITKKLSLADSITVLISLIFSFQASSKKVVSVMISSKFLLSTVLG